MLQDLLRPFAIFFQTNIPAVMVNNRNIIAANKDDPPTDQAFETGEYDRRLSLVRAEMESRGLSAMVIGGAIRPRGGGFMLWPGSHKRLHPYWRTVHGGAMAAENAEPFLAAREQILSDTMPVEFTGAPGDVIFWHPRTLHSAGLNHSADEGEPVGRVIIPCDYQVAGRDYVDDPDYGPGADFQWWIDTRNFEGDVPPTADNMWDDWGI